MNSYPAELVYQHFPCMLVAGLINPDGNSSSSSSSSNPNPAPNSNGNHQSSTPASSTPSPSASFPSLTKDLVEIFGARGKNAVWDPARGGAAVFKSVMVDHSVRLPPRKTRPSPRSVAAPISTSDSNPTESSSAALSSLPARSPLSPLHPGSPLFPDGIIAPIWLRKHRELVPSVFVAFHCLSEPPPLVSVSSNGDSNNTTEGRGLEVSNMEELKAKDEELIKIISERKRNLVERGIKLTVVLLTNRSMLENPQLEARLSYLRRSSGLDSKASLFVLTPVSRSELGEFVTSLQGALYDSALDFYREHSRRIRRKRPRYPPPPSIVQPILNAVSGSTSPSTSSNLVPLSREGWQIRVEYKLATFSELQGDNENAMNHYLEAYDILASNLLGSTMHLPPRTKRWAEAKVLADALSIRICKLHLYNDDGLKAKLQFEKHIHRFVELSTGWGIGEATFEFWSWLGKQYRMFGDLIDVATREIPGAPLPPFLLPVHAPPLPSNILHPLLVSSAASGGLDIRYLYPGLHAPSPTAINSGVSPSALLQGAGGFYYIAALCSIERRERFIQMEKKEMEISGKDSSLEKNPALAHEKKIDHLGQITEALTRAYEAFKKARQTRLSLFVASKIAYSYHANGQSEMALRFLERIAKTYRKERWSAPLASLLPVASECAKNSGEVASRAKILFELLDPDLPLSSEQRIETASQLGDLLKDGNLPEGKRPLVMTFGESIERDRGEETSSISSSSSSSSTALPTYKTGFLKLEIVFFPSQAESGSSIPFQVQLSAPESGALGALQHLQFYALHLFFQQDEGTGEEEKRGEERLCAIIKMGEQKERIKSELIKIGSVELGGEVRECETDLRWTENSAKVFEGTLSSTAAGALRLSRAVLIAGGDRVPIHISLSFSRPDPFSTPRKPNWFIARKSKASASSRSPLRCLTLPQRLEPGLVVVKPRMHKVDLTLAHEEEIYLDEDFEIKVGVKNEEAEDLDCQLDVELADVGSGSDGRAYDFLSFEDSKDPFSLKGLSVGTLKPSSSANLSFYLHTSHLISSRSINVTLKTRISSSSTSSEIIRPIQLPVIAPFAQLISPRWSVERERNAARRRHEARRGLEDNGELTDSEDDGETLQVERSAKGNLCASFSSLAPRPLEIQSISLKLDQSDSDVWILPCSSNSTSDVSGIWEQGDRFSTVHDIEAICEDYDAPTTEELPTPRRRDFYEIKWRRASSTSNASNYFTTLIPTPSLLPPKLELGPAILIVPPPTVNLNIPFNLPMIVSNLSNRSSDILISLESSESFIFSGPRTLSIPNLLSETERKVQLRLVPVMVGRGKLPTIRAWDRNQAATQGDEGRPLRIQSSSTNPFVLVQ